MEPSLPGDHGFEPVGAQQITEDDVRTFLQSFPEFKDCRFEVEIVQASQPTGLPPFAAQYEDLVSAHGDFVDTTDQHLSILPPELRDQYVRVDCINLPYSNQVPPPSDAYTRVDPDSEYVPPTEADFKDTIWNYENSRQERTTNHLSSAAVPKNIVATPYYSIQQQHSDNASSKTSTPIAEDDLPPVYRVPPAPHTVQNNNPTASRISHSPVSNASSSAVSLVEVQKSVDSRPAAAAVASPLVVKEHFENSSSNDYQKETPATQEASPTANQLYSGAGRSLPREVDNGVQANVSELSKRFAETSFLPVRNGVDRNDRRPNDVQRSRSSTAGRTPSSADQERSPKRTSARRSRTAESASIPNRRRNDAGDNYSGQQMERRKHRHSGHDRLRRSSRDMAHDRTKSFNRKYRHSPSISFSKNQKYCYINGEKFRMVDYADIVEQDIDRYQQQQQQQNQYGVPMENGYYPTVQARPLTNGTVYAEYATPPRFVNQMDERIYGRPANYLSGTLPRRRGRHVINQEMPAVARVYGTRRRRQRNRMHSTHKERPMYDRTPILAAPGTREWSKLVSFPRSGPPLYNPPYTNFSMWA